MPAEAEAIVHDFLTTLAACLSGRPAVTAGEELTGLTQAVLTAGAETVVVSLWSVSDVSTRVLFEQFYSAVATVHQPPSPCGRPPRAGAGQEGREHPHYWAAFTVNGLPDRGVTSLRDFPLETFQSPVYGLRGESNSDNFGIARSKRSSRATAINADHSPQTHHPSHLVSGCGQLPL